MWLKTHFFPSDNVIAATALAFVIVAALIHSAYAIRPEKTETSCSDGKFDQPPRCLSKSKNAACNKLDDYCTARNPG